MPLVYAVSICEVDRVLSKVKRYGILKNKKSDSDSSAYFLKPISEIQTSVTFF